MTCIRRTLPALFIFCLLPVVSLAHSGTVSGRVIDETGGALPGVTVLLRTGSEAPTETVSGEDGEYRLTNVLFTARAACSRASSISPRMSPSNRLAGAGTASRALRAGGLRSGFFLLFAMFTRFLRS